MSKVSYVLEFSINDGKLEEFKAKSTAYIEAVKANEPGAITYQWFLAEDGKRCLVHEAFRDSDALMAHLGHVGPTLPDLLAIAPITRLEELGSASDAARAALAQLGAVHFPHLGGFDR